MPSLWFLGFWSMLLFFASSQHPVGPSLFFFWGVPTSITTIKVRNAVSDSCIVPCNGVGSCQLVQ